MFEQVNDLETLRAQWREAAARLHPDKGGAADAFIAARRDYENATRRIEEQQQRANAEAARAQKTRETLGRVGDILTKMSRGENWLDSAANLFADCLPQQYREDGRAVCDILNNGYKVYNRHKK